MAELQFRPGGLASQPACSLPPRLLNGARASPGTLENHPGHSRAGKREDSGGKRPDSGLLIPPQHVLRVSSLLRSTAGGEEADGASVETLTGQAEAHGEQLSLSFPPPTFLVARKSPSALPSASGEGPSPQRGPLPSASLKLDLIYHRTEVFSWYMASGLNQCPESSKNLPAEVTLPSTFRPAGITSQKKRNRANHVPRPRIPGENHASEAEEGSPRHCGTRGPPPGGLLR